MRKTLCTLALLLCGYTFAQDQWQQIFRTDPYLSNGYFIVNHDAWQRMGLAKIDIDINMSTLQSNGAIAKSTLQQFSITDNFYGKADLGFLDSIQANQIAYYDLSAYDTRGNVVFTYQGMGEPGPVWPEVCSRTCIAPSYSWTLHTFSDGVQSLIKLWPGSDNGSYYYFYVKAGDDWNWFVQHYSPSDFGLNGTWGQYLGNGSLAGDLVHHYEGGLAEPPDPLPLGATNMEGYPISTEYLEQGGYAVAKLLGPWANGDILETENISTGGSNLCVDNGNALLEFFNADLQVQAHLNGRPMLRCDGTLALGGGAGWGGPNGWLCTSTTEVMGTDEDGNPLVIGWSETVAECVVRPDGYTPSPVEVKVHHWDPLHKDPVLNIHIPSGKDTKLIPVPKTVLEPGLYEYTVTMDDGTILHHYEDYSTPVVINAVYADFSTINIYPVPVKDSFSADFDLLTPMDINMTVVDNMGDTYYQKSLHFPMAGRNKHVVRMDQQWPAGLYHAIFQYADGSSESLNFTVAQ